MRRFELATKATLARLSRKSNSRLLSTSPTTEKNQDESAVPPLKHVPSLPFVGSMIPQYSGIPGIDFRTIYDYHPTIREKFGEFYSMGIPGLGSGSHGTVYATVDPNEMMKVVRNEGSYPSGSLETNWHMRRVFKNASSPMVQGDDYGIFDRGERWKKHRVFLQTGMLCPRAAKNFVPGMVKAAQMASSGASRHTRDLNQYLNYCAIDLFYSFMFGEFLGLAARDPDESGSDEKAQFCDEVLNIVELTIKLALSPYELAMSERVGIKTAKFAALEKSWDTAHRMGMKVIHSFLQHREKGDLNDMQKSSYLAGAIERQAQEGEEGVSKEEMIELCFVTLFAAVDTTSTTIAWILVHLALNPEVQERLHEELSRAVSASEGGQLDASILSKSSSPYLHAVVRESLRMTPPFMMAQLKSNQKSEIDIHGVTLPKGSLVLLTHVGRDPSYVDDPDSFKPERWFPDAVESRRGTRSELIDHPMLRDPFFQGARRCPASRVASNEILTMVSQLVLDWKISSPVVKSLKDITYVGPIIKPEIPVLEFKQRAG